MKKHLYFNLQIFALVAAALCGWFASDWLMNALSSDSDVLRFVLLAVIFGLIYGVLIFIAGRLCKTDEAPKTAPNQLTRDQIYNLRMMKNSGEMIEVVRTVHEMTGLSLKDSKDFVDRL